MIKYRHIIKDKYLKKCILNFCILDIIHGKLDQRNRQLEVDYAIGRDIRPNDIGKISATLKEWCNSCETVLNCLEEQIVRANANKAQILRHKENIDQEVILILITFFFELKKVNIMFVTWRYSINRA